MEDKTTAKHTGEELMCDNILTKEEALMILTRIAQGIAAEGAKAPSDADRLRAIDRLARMEGWDTVTNSQNPQTKELTILFENFDDN